MKKIILSLTTILTMSSAFAEGGLYDRGCRTQDAEAAKDDYQKDILRFKNGFKTEMQLLDSEALYLDLSVCADLMSPTHFCKARLKNMAKKYDLSQKLYEGGVLTEVAVTKVQYQYEKLVRGCQ